MTHPMQSNELGEAVQLLAENGFEGMANAMQILFNEAMRLERTEYIGAQPYERNEQRRSYANGFKPKTVSSRLGKLESKAPQTRDGDFYPSALERGERSERAFKLAVSEKYVQGVSTRKVAKITAELRGLDVTSTQVSRAAVLLDEELKPSETGPLTRSTTSSSMLAMRKFVSPEASATSWSRSASNPTAIEASWVSVCRSPRRKCIGVSFSLRSNNAACTA